MTEVIHLGQIPVYIYDDYPWIPYRGTTASVENFGYLVQVTRGGLKRLSQDLSVTSAQEIDRKRAAVLEARWAYTYDGVIKELELFFNNPLAPPRASSAYKWNETSMIQCANIPYRPKHLAWAKSDLGQ
jgi:hypothetical protein